MTVAATERIAGPFSGNDVATSFPFSFRTNADSDILATLIDADGVETEWVLDSDYTVTLNADQENDPGGSIEATTAPATGETLILISNMEFTQPTDLPDGGRYRAASVEAAIDRAIMLIQQMHEVQGRTLRLPVATDMTQVNRQLPAPDAGKFWRWNLAGTDVEYIDAGLDGTDGFTQSGTGAVERAWSAKAGEVVSIADFGGSAGATPAENTAALTAAWAAHESVFLPGTGVYTFSPILLPDDGTYRLYSNGATIKLASLTDDYLITNESVAGLVDYFEMFGVHVDGNYAGQAGFHEGVVKVRARRAHIAKCRFKNCSGTSLWLRHIEEHADVAGNVFELGKEHTGVLGEVSCYMTVQTDPAQAASDKQHIAVHHNHFYGITPSVVGRGVGGINMASNEDQIAGDSQQVIVVENWFYDCGVSAAGNVIAAINGYRLIGRSIIAHNHVFGGDEAGIVVQGSKNVLISTNEVHDVGTWGILVSARDSADEGSGTKVSEDISILGNTLSGMTTAIRDRNSAAGPGLNHKINGNIIRNVGQAIQAQYIYGIAHINDNIIDGVTEAAPGTGERAIDFYNEATAWVNTTAYTYGDVVQNDTDKIYLCVTPDPGGTSAGAGGPTGTGAGIADGTVTWDYLYTIPKTLLKIVDNTVNDSANTGLAVRGVYRGIVEVDHNTINGMAATNPIWLRNCGAETTIKVADNIEEDLFDTTAIEFHSCLGDLYVSSNIAPAGSVVDLVSGSSTPRYLANSWDSVAYTLTNDLTDRAYDADTVVVAELADVVATLIKDLQARGAL